MNVYFSGKYCQITFSHLKDSSIALLPERAFIVFLVLSLTKRVSAYISQVACCCTSAVSTLLEGYDQFGRHLVLKLPKFIWQVEWIRKTTRLSLVVFACKLCFKTKKVMTYMRCKSWLAFSPYPNTYINLEYAFYKKHYVSLRLNIAKKYAGCFNNDQ